MSLDAVAPILEMRGVSKKFGATYAIEQITFDVSPGEIHSILGENGAGKSTLVKILCGQVTPTAGEVLFDGHKVEFFSPAKARQIGVAMVQQELSVFDHLTVAENLFPDYRPAGRRGWISRSRLYRAAEDACRRLNFEIDVRRLVADLTPGQKQLVEILRCVSANPRVLILDEPTSGLNTREGEALVELLHRLRAQGVTILYISHRIPEVLALSDRITILRDGKKRETLVNRDLTEDALVAFMIGRDLTGLYQRETLGYRGDNTTVFQAQALAASATSPEVNLAVRRGEILGVFGLEGSGTFELAERLAGLRGHTSGSLRIGQRTCHRWNPRELAELGVPFLYSNRKEAGLFLNLDVAENVAAPRLRRLSRWGLLQKKVLATAVAQAIALFGIKARPNGQLVRNLSGGNQQKLMLSLALERRPVCFIVSEPTRGVDVGAKLAIHKLMKRLATDGGSILLFTSELPELLSLAHAALVMRDGRVVKRLEGDAMSEERVMASAAGTAIHA